MNVDHLFELGNHIFNDGFNINLEEMSVLKNSLKLLQQENHFKNVYFWGKIFGTENNYFIAFGYNEDCFLDKTYFYCTDLLQWVMLSKIKKNSKIIDASFNFLRGDPISDLKMSLAYSPNTEHLSEECFLSNVIATISHEVEIVPRGFFIKTNNVTIENKAFNGLNHKNSQCLAFYYHYRKPICKWNKIALTKKDFHYSTDFLDSIDIDTPKGCWVMSKVINKDLITLKSLLWPGMVFFLKPNSLIFGSVYIGHGHKNLDLPFMI